MKLQIKITVLIVAIAICFGLLDVYTNNIHIKSALEKDLLRRSTELSQRILNDNQKYITENNYGELQYNLIYTAKHNSYIKYIYFKNKNSDIVAHTFTKDIPNHVRNIELDTIQQGVRYTSYTVPTGTIFHTIPEASSLKSESLHIGLQSNLLDHQLARIQQQKYLYSILIALIGITVAFFLVTRVTNPLSLLAAQIRNFGHGKIKSPDQINFSSSNYEVNLMSNALKQMLSDRQNLEDNLLNKDAEFSAIFYSITDAAVFTDVSRKIKVCNPAVSKLFGYSNQELIGRNTEMLYADPGDYLDQGQKRYRTGKETDNSPYIMRYKRKDGNEIYCETRGTQVKDSLGNVIGFIGILRDITEERKLAQELNQFKSTLDDTLDCVFMFRPDNLKFFYVNKGATEQVGYSKEDLLKMTPIDVKPEYDEASFRRLLQPLLEHKSKSITFETVHKHRDGKLVPVEIFLQYIDPPGESPRFVAVVRDLSERKRSEQVQYEQHQLLALVVNNTPVIIWSTDLQGVFKLSVGKGLESLGLKPGEVIGQSALELYKDNSQIVGDLQRALRGETLVSNASVAGRCYESYYAPMLDSNGELVGTWGIAIDITDRRQAEEELRRHRDHLEELVSQRTKELEAANKELEAFSYSVSHDLRAPLRTIDGFSHTLLEDYSECLDEDANEYLERIRNGTNRMAQLIDDLLQLSRVTRSEIIYSDIDLSAMAHTIAKELINSDKTRQVEIIIEPDLYIKGDITLIQVMLQNLLDNAWKYTSKKQHARVELGRDRTKGKNVFYVRDNGSGFDMKYVDKLFGAFQRLHGADEFEGTGIGLATVQRIVMRHGGHIWAESKLNEGTTFYVELVFKDETN